MTWNPMQSDTLQAFYDDILNAEEEEEDVDLTEDVKIEEEEVESIFMDPEEDESTSLPIWCRDDSAEPDTSFGTETSFSLPLQVVLSQDHSNYVEEEVVRERSPLRWQEELVEYELVEEEVVEEEVDTDYVPPDVHQIFNIPDSMYAMSDSMSEEESEMIGMDSGVRTAPVASGSRGRGRGRGRGNGARSAWKRGHPLIEMYATDEDVPPALTSMIEEIVQKREERERDLRRRQMKKEARISERANEKDLDTQDFYEADDGRDASLLTGLDREFRWSPMNSFQGRRETFEVPVTGPTQPYNSMYEAFRSYWTDDILTHIVTETNRYAGLICNAGDPVYSASFAKEWYDTNIHEILMLFAFWMMLGIMRMPTIKSCFTTHPLLQTDVFRQLFTSKRYGNLVRALYFCDKDAHPTTSSRLHHLGPILSHLNLKFKENYIPNQNICIDESLTLWKGILLFKQYIKTKKARFGIKTFELCESATGYLCSFTVYTGKSEEETTGSSILKSTAVVLRLIRPYLDKGYTLFLDNWFNAPILARFLKSRKTDCVGTLRSNRKDLPALVIMADLYPGQYIARHAGDVCVQSWFDKKKVLTISTYHGCEVGSVITGRGNRRTLIHKPQVILDYNQSMGGVDLKDQMLEPYLLERKRGSRWYMKLFKRLLNCSINNSRIMVASTKGRAIVNLVSRLSLVDDIMKKHADLVPRLHQRKSIPPPVKSQVNHWPMPISNERDSKNRKPRKRCAWCYKNGADSRTTFQCEQCMVGLCIPCFKPFHLHKDGT